MTLIENGLYLHSNSSFLDVETYIAKTVLTLFLTRFKISPYHTNPFIKLATYCFRSNPQIKSCMITTKNNTLEKLMRPLLCHSID